MRRAALLLATLLLAACPRQTPPASPGSGLPSDAVNDPDVLVTGHPFVDVWAGIRPRVVGLAQWPEVPKGDLPWKEELCRRLGVPFEGFWPRLRNGVKTYADLSPELVEAVERLIDFVGE